MAKKNNKRYAKWTERNGVFIAIDSQHPAHGKLPAGVYELEQDMHGRTLLSNMDTAHDELIDLPTPEYNLVISQIEMFFTPECRAKFDKYGFLYKRSALIYGPPGTGKTCLVNRIAEYAVERNGVVLFNPHPQFLPNALEMLEDVQPETTVVVIFEEVDKLLRSFEGHLINILDGEVQKNNIIYLATTNFIEQIPARIKRPGRFSSLVEVGYPNASAREHYLNLKVKGEVTAEAIQVWVDKTHGFSIDELKETVLATMCLGQTLDDVVGRIRASRPMPSMLQVPQQAMLALPEEPEEIKV